MANVTISDNTIESDTRFTDGYGIVIDGVHGFVVSGNTITAGAGKSSRGILLDEQNGIPDPSSSDGEVYDNYVDVQERPNLEYGVSGLEATAFRWRPWNDCTNIHIYDNTFIARTDATLVHAAYGGRISFLVDNTGGDLNNFVTDNVFEAIVGTTDTSFYAIGLSLESIGVNDSPHFVGNTVESNDTSLAFSGNDSAGVNVNQGLLTSTVIRKSSDGVARAYKSILAGYWIMTVQNVSLIDTSYEGGATPDISWSGSGVKAISIGSLLGVQVESAGGAPLAGATVRVLDKDGGQVFSGTSDANGLLTDIPIVTAVYRQAGTNPSVITTDPRGPFQIQVSLARYATSNQSVTLDQSQAPPSSSWIPASIIRRWRSTTATALNQDEMLAVAAKGVLANDTDADGDALTAALVSGPSHGTLTLNANGSFTYTPTAGYYGADSFTYKANDGLADSNVATVSLTVNTVNHPPVAVNDSYSVNEDAVLTVAAPGVLVQRHRRGRQRR